MTTPKVLVRLICGVALGLLLPGTARADTTVSPSTVSVGEVVTLNATNCHSTAEDALFLVRGPGQERNITAAGGTSAQLRTTDLAPGTYTVTAVCGDGASAGQTSFTIAATGDKSAEDARRYEGAVAVAGGAALLAHTLGGVIILGRRRRHAAGAATF